MIIKKLVLFVMVLCFSSALYSQPLVTVVTYNIFHGANTNDSYDLDKIAELIKSVNPDFVALQEVDSKTDRTSKLDLAYELGSRTNMDYIFGKAINFDNGEYGVAILAKNKIISSTNYSLPQLNNNEPRVALEIITTLSNGDTVSFITSHLNYKPNSLERIEQVKELNKLFESNKYSTILAGDFNDVPNSTAINILEENWEATYKSSSSSETFPSNKPDRKIDYIMFKPKNSFMPVENGVICDSIASDHCAYWVTLELVK